MNPFTERGRITEPERFAGRWRELSLIFERLEHSRPVLIVGAPGIGKSSLLTHVAQSASAVMDIPELESLYADLAKLPDAESCYRLVIQALGSRGNSSTDLEVALLESDGPVLLSLDNVDAAMAAGWGELLLERLARVARGSATTSGRGLLLVTAGGPGVPLLSEPYAVLTLGALAPTEVRLLLEAYLDGTGVSFSTAEMNDLALLSAGHPAYLQRAAYHLFIAKTNFDYDWRGAYLTEAQEHPIPGAPLPDAVFEGGSAGVAGSNYGDSERMEGVAGPETRQLEGIGPLLTAIVPLVLALLVLQTNGNWLAAGIVLIVGIGVGLVLGRRRGTQT
ncbi:MAG: ATP-binding protein [Chloroflexaceae bacterium]|jgi:hypothetical protein|nr:ATP-binding protein [Chloroflexaceae bacterium]